LEFPTASNGASEFRGETAFEPRKSATGCKAFLLCLMSSVFLNFGISAFHLFVFHFALSFPLLFALVLLFFSFVMSLPPPNLFHRGSALRSSPLSRAAWLPDPHKSSRPRSRRLPRPPPRPRPSRPSHRACRRRQRRAARASRRRAVGNPPAPRSGGEPFFAGMFIFAARGKALREEVAPSQR